MNGISNLGSGSPQWQSCEDRDRQECAGDCKMSFHVVNLVTVMSSITDGLGEAVIFPEAPLVPD